MRTAKRPEAREAWSRALARQRHPDPGLRAPGKPDELVLHFVLQSKTPLCSVSIAITDQDEPLVRRFLEECATTIAAIWEPVRLAPPADARA